MTWVVGRVDRSVTRVRIDTSMGSVDATVSNGDFAAWWPGNADTAVVHVHRGRTEVATADQLTCTTAKGTGGARWLRSSSD